MIIKRSSSFRNSTIKGNGVYLRTIVYGFLNKKVPKYGDSN